MEVGVSTLHLLRHSFSTVLRRISKSSFGLWEIFDEDNHQLTQSRVKELKRLAKRRDLKFTVHGPISDLNMASFNPDVRRLTVKRLGESLENAASLEAYSWLTHPGMHSALSGIYPHTDWKLNQHSISRLLNLAEKLDIRIAVENVAVPNGLLRTSREFQRLIRSSPPLGSHFGIGLDVGHAHILHETERFLENHSHRISHVHLHDNRGDFDSHLPIGKGTISWPMISKALRKLNPSTSLVVESYGGILHSYDEARRLFLG